jgi:hypothetical protein
MIVFPETRDLALVRNSRTSGHPAQPGYHLVVWSTGIGLPELITAGKLQLGVGTLYANADEYYSLTGPQAYTASSCERSQLRRCRASGTASASASGHPVDSNEVTVSLEPIQS